MLNRILEMLRSIWDTELYLAEVDTFIDGKKVTTLRGDNIATEFRQIVDDYIKQTYAQKKSSIN